MLFRGSVSTPITYWLYRQPACDPTPLCPPPTAPDLRGPGFGAADRPDYVRALEVANAVGGGAVGDPSLQPDFAQLNNYIEWTAVSEGAR